MHLVDQYKICKERGHDSSHAINSGTQTYYRCKYCGKTYFDEIVRKEIKYVQDVYDYLQEIKENKNG